MQKIMISFVLLFITRLVYHASVVAWYLKTARDNDNENDELNATVLSLNECGLYISDRMSLILLYRFL